MNIEENVQSEQKKIQFNIEIFIYENLDESLKIVKFIEIYNVKNFQARHFKSKGEKDITCPIEISRDSNLLTYATSMKFSDENHMFGCLKPNT